MLKKHRHANCTKVLNHHALHQQMQQKCHKRQKCTLDTRKLVDLGSIEVLE